MAANTEMSDKSLIFIFIDGIGIGEGDPLTNPFRYLSSGLLPFSSPLLPASSTQPYCLKAIDASLNVDGIPQSGSGQTTLFTGISYPKISGEHSASFPTQAMRKILGEHNLLKQLISKRHQARFFNAYPFHADLFCAPNLNLCADGSLLFSDTFPLSYRRRISATTTMMLSIGQKAASEHDLRQKTAIYQDFSNKSLISRGADVPAISPTEAGFILGKAGRDKPGLILYEFFISDQIGHRGQLSDAVLLLEDLESFVAAVIDTLDPDVNTVLLSSDHGNLEEMNHRGHTRNPVPLWVWGRGRKQIAEQVNSIADVTPAIIQFFSEEE